MIGMMYLVLTALLALNISKEVLNGFVKVEKSLRTTQGTLNGKVKETMGELEGKYAANKEKVQPFMTQAQELNKRAEALVQYITQLKARSMSASVGDYAEQEGAGFSKYIGKDEFGNDTTLSLMYIDKKDEYQSLTAFMVGSEPQAPKQDEWSAHMLRVKMEEFRDYIKAIKFKDNLGGTRELPDYIKDQVDATFHFGTEMEDGKEVLWEAANFYDVPLAAVMPLMTKMTLDIQDAQEDILAWLLSGVDAKSYKFTKLRPIVVVGQNYLLRGDSMRADILLAAYDETNRPSIVVGSSNFSGTKPSGNVNGTPLKVSADGLGLFRRSTSGMPIGDVTYEGVIRYQGPDGAIETHPFVTPTFTIAEPALVVSPTKMNVFYRGLDNPVEISVPGVASDKLTATISGDHKLTRGADGTFIVRPGASPEANITVTATMPDGSKKTMPPRKFRVKRVPDPVPVFAGKVPTDRSIAKGDLQVAVGVAARMENFDFEVATTVRSFRMTATVGGNIVEKESNSNKVTADMKAMLEQVRKGNLVMLSEIRVAMPDGTDRILPSITLKVN
jgi:gliding motility-associated protein GldM